MSSLFFTRGQSFRLPSNARRHQLGSKHSIRGHHGSPTAVLEYFGRYSRPLHRTLYLGNISVKFVEFYVFSNLLEIFRFIPFSLHKIIEIQLILKYPHPLFMFRTRQKFHIHKLIIIISHCTRVMRSRRATCQSKYLEVK